jgi:hypothetical protein
MGQHWYQYERIRSWLYFFTLYAMIAEDTTSIRNSRYTLHLASPVRVGVAGILMVCLQRPARMSWSAYPPGITPNKPPRRDEQAQSNEANFHPPRQCRKQEINTSLHARMSTLRSRGLLSYYNATLSDF